MSFKKRNHSSSLLARLEQSKKSKEHKKIFATKTSVKVPNTEKQSKQKKNAPNVITKDITLFEIEERIREAVHEQNNLLYSAALGDDLQEVGASHAYTELASIMVQLKIKKDICLFLSWPDGFEWPGLAHALANRALSTLNDTKAGMRVALYPSVRSTYSHCKKTFFPVSTFLKEAQMHANALQQVNALGALSKRDRAFFTFNKLEKLDEKAKNPSLQSAIPIFEWGGEEVRWHKIGEPYLKSTRSVLRRVHASSSQEDIDYYAEVQDNPSMSEEGIFCIGKKYSPSAVCKLLLDNQQRFDLIVIDAREKMLHSLKNWRDIFSKLANNISIAEDAPSLVILCDNPVFYSDLRYQIEALGAKKNRPNTSLSKQIKIFHLLRDERSTWALPQNVPDSISKREPVFSVKITDKGAMDKIHSVLRCAKSLSDEHPEAKNELFKLTGFLRNLIETPIGQRDTREWLRELTKSDSAAQSSYKFSKYEWGSYKHELANRLNSFGVTEHRQVKKALQIADEFVKLIESYTEIQLYLREILENNYINNKKTLVVVPLSYHVEALQRALNEHMGDDWSRLIDIRIQDDMSVEYADYQAIVMAGKVERKLSTLLLSTALPEEICLLISAYGAERIEKSLRVLLSLPEFSKITSRAQYLFDNIQKILASIGRLGLEIRDAEILEHFSEYHLHGHASAETYAWIDFYGHDSPYSVGKYSTLIKYSSGDLSSYLAVGLDQISEGDQILLLDEGLLREQMEEYLSASGVDLEKNAKKSLAHYFATAKQQLEKFYNFDTRQHQAKEILNKMRKINPEIGVTIESVNRWIKGIKEHEQYSEEELQTHSAQNELNFTVFAEALNIDKVLAGIYFNVGIQKCRTGRILQGRQIGYQLRVILTGSDRPESMGISIDQHNVLMEMAKENIYTIKMIRYNDEEEKHD